MVQGAAGIRSRICYLTSIALGGFRPILGAGCIAVGDIVGKAMAQGAAGIRSRIRYLTSIALCGLRPILGTGCIAVGDIVGKAMVQSMDHHSGLVCDHHCAGRICKPLCTTGAGVVRSMACPGTGRIFRRNQSQTVDMRSIQHNGQFQYIGVNLSCFLAYNAVGLFLCSNRLLINCVVLTFPGIFLVFSGGITGLAETQTGHQKFAAFSNRQNTAFRNFHSTILAIGTNHHNGRHFRFGCIKLIFSRCAHSLDRNGRRSSSILRMDLHHSKAHIRTRNRESEVAVTIRAYDFIEELRIALIGCNHDLSTHNRIAIGIQKSSLQLYLFCYLHNNRVVCGCDLRHILFDGQILRNKLCAQRDTRIVLHGSAHRYLYRAGQRFTILTGYH